MTVYNSENSLGFLRRSELNAKNHLRNEEINGTDTGYNWS